ncbi:Tyrosinase [Neolecta irregularis DAH-3]|uniref:tyrosinase n=1 Tax=Neolecta irregularis (strain DAH-3) TaxID=1198029 RepID=A0A1U7LR76_NEOID|nr:Tyrosinase [Neolecta irregularis DAH-3]|eukprot:OLL25128.1 Tyrosinase [Neolecta irregularis DAH-3]
MTSKSHYHVTGVPVVIPAGALPPPRKEIREFVKDADVLNLFILANAELQKAAEDSVTSWFQIAGSLLARGSLTGSGIHGRPYVAWDGVTTNSSDPSRASWHRPFVSLYEQSVYLAAQKIAGEFPQKSRSRWLEAASLLRVPYWDFALDITLPDIFLRDETVIVTTPTGQQTIPNPLYSFKFNPVGKDFGENGPQWAIWPRTLRYPNNTRANATSQPRRVSASLNNIRQHIRDRTYALLTHVKSWEVFSNHTFTEEHPHAYDSVESIHDTLHVVVGGEGHMASPDFAAFDSIFWLLHVQVDRLTAIWQTINPDVWVTPGPSPFGTFMSAMGSLVHADSDLYPFHIDDLKYWNSNACRDWNQLGYTYPDFVLAGKQSPSSLQQFMLGRVSELYSPQMFKNIPVAATPNIGKDVFVQQSDLVKARDAQVLSGKVKPSETEPKSHPLKTSVFEKKSTVSLPSVTSGKTSEGPHLQTGKNLGDQVSWDDRTEDKFDIMQSHSIPHDSNGYREWLVNLRILKYAVHGSFFIYIFLGPVPEDSDNWATTKTMVGLHSVFANPPSSRCGNCERQRDANIITSGTIPLTGALIEAHIGLDQSQVEPYLRANLHWRVQKVDGTVVEKNDVTSLTVSVSSAWISFEQGDNLGPPIPRRSDWITHRSVTRGRRGGMDAH